MHKRGELCRPTAATSIVPRCGPVATDLRSGGRRAWPGLEMVKRHSLLRSMLSVSGGTFVSRLLGLAREVAIATAFGASAMTDAFWVAFRIPNFLRRLFAEGSFSLAFVPVLTQVKAGEDHDELRDMIARTAGTLSGILMLVTALGVLGADVLARLFAPGSVGDPLKLQVTGDLLRLTFPYLMFVSLTALAGGVLNSFHRFALPALTPVLLNLAMIFAALWLAPLLEVPIMALGWAVLAAGIMQLLLQLPALHGLNLLTLPRWGWRHPQVRRIFQLMIPTLFGSSVAQVNLLLDTIIASFLITGSQTWLAQSDRLLEFPLGIFGVALGTVILPTLSRHHVSTDGAAFARALDWGLRTASLIAVPAMLALFLLAGPLVSTLFQHGQFTPHDVRMATLSLSALALGLPAFALIKVVAPAFYARQDTRTPVRAGVIAMIASMLLNFVFVGLLYLRWGGAGGEGAADGIFAAIAATPGLHMGLALSSALAGYMNLILLWRALARDGIFRAQPGWTRHLLRLAFACTVMVAVLLLALSVWQDWTTWPAWLRIQRLAVLVCAGAAAYVSSLFLAGFRLNDLRAG